MGKKTHVLFWKFWIAFFIYFCSWSSARNILSSCFVSNNSHIWSISDRDDNNAYEVFYARNFQRSNIIFARISRARTEFACGFFCNSYPEIRCIFGIVCVGDDAYSARMVWSANMNQTFQTNASLNLTSDGDLALMDGNGSLVWHTDTAGKSVMRVELTESGNLVLFDGFNRSVWESFENPTDSLLPGQYLYAGQNLTSEGGGTTLLVTTKGVSAYINSDPPLLYLTPSELHILYYAYRDNNVSYIKLGNQTLDLGLEINGSVAPFPIRKYEDYPSTAKCMKLESSGHVSFYSFRKYSWDMEAQSPFPFHDKCRYPLICGRLGVCSDRGYCSCPDLRAGKQQLFNSIGEVVEAEGCSEIVPIKCGDLDDHILLELKDVTYFPFITRSFPSNVLNTSLETCKLACISNCACKAAMYESDKSTSYGICFLPTEIFSLIKQPQYSVYGNLNVFIKVQKEGSKVPGVVITGSVIGGLIAMTLLVFLLYKLRMQNDKIKESDEEEFLDLLPGMPTRFSYRYLKSLTFDFSIKLGEGGFGSVFEGAMADGTRIAVKHLDGVIHINKSFLAEVETIGTIHHMNLVQLIGFCAEKSHRLLVYEYMQNGSLDRWIFNKQQDDALDLQTRKRIIVDVARGLAYLHEECRRKVIHLDIKPQNILLDEDFNAKVSDFGLSKLIDRNQSRVVTRMRGTPGYMGPEWLSSVVTEKLDVYSFGVVTLEILTGRKNLDSHQPEDEKHLLSLFERMAQDNHLVDLVDKYSEDMQLHGAEVVEMMKVAAWCLQGDFSKRPSMSMVVKVLEGVKDVEENIDYIFTNIQLHGETTANDQRSLHSKKFSVVPPSVLSAPR